MKLRAVRLLVKNGNSYTVGMPRAFLMNMRLYRGAELELIYDDDNDTVTIRALNPVPRNIKGMSSAHTPRPVIE